MRGLACAGAEACTLSAARHGVSVPACVPRARCAALQRTTRGVQTAALRAPKSGASLEPLRSARLITAIKTPYREDGRFDLDRYDALVSLQIEHGVQGLIIGGTTGEGQLMSWDEHIMLIAHTVNQFGRRVLVIGNTGSNSTREAVHASEQGFAVGMHASLHINPYYGKTSESGVLAHLRGALDEGPGIVYNVPSRTGQDLSAELVAALSAHPGFVGVKECMGNDRVGTHAARGIATWSGNDDEAHAARHSHGATGVISVASNLLPGAFAALMHAPNADLAERCLPLLNWLFCEPNPIALNTALAMCGLAQPVFRLPYVPLDRAQRERGSKLLEGVLDLIPGVRRVRIMEDDEFTLLPRY